MTCFDYFEMLFMLVKVVTVIIEVTFFFGSLEAATGAAVSSVCFAGEQQPKGAFL